MNLRGRCATFDDLAALNELCPSFSLNPENTVVLETETGTLVALAVMWDAGHEVVPVAWMVSSEVNAEDRPGVARVLYGAVRSICEARGRTTVVGHTDHAASRDVLIAGGGVLIGHWYIVAFPVSSEVPAP